MPEVRSLVKENGDSSLSRQVREAALQNTESHARVRSREDSHGVISQYNSSCKESYVHQKEFWVAIKMMLTKRTA